MSAPELVAGSVIAGKYTVRSLLLHGGATATYRALAAKNREVALKVYDAAILAFPDVLQTLAQHQSIGAKLPPQQIVPIAESGTDPNSGAPFTVTDFQSWPSLAQLIDRGPLSASEMLALVRNLARATDLLHSSGITKLSLHPTNVFVSPGAQYEVRVADFGSSLVRRALPVPEKAGRWMPWLAPEQMKGEVPPAQAADMFALGLIAFFAVTGKPYWRSSQMKTPDTAALRREILGERMPASVRASEFSITLNPAVDAVFIRALAFRPADRYSTAREFSADLDAALSDRDAAPVAKGIAPPPPRKMLPRATMLGMGSPAAVDPAAMAAAARPPLATMHGIGEPVAEAKAAAPATATAPAKISAPGTPTAPARGAPPAKTFAPAMAKPPAETAAPAMTAAPAKASAPATTAPRAVLAAPVAAVTPAMSPAPAMPAATAIQAAPAMPVAPAMSAEPPLVVPPGTTARRGGPPPLPMAPPSAQLEEVPLQATPAWPTAEHDDSGGEHVETGAATIGAAFAHTLKNSRLRWVASVCGLLVLTGGAAWALSGGRTSGSRGHAASEAKVAATAPAPPAPTVQDPEAAEPAAPAAPPPTAAEPAAPAADSNAAAQPATVPDRSAPSPTLAPGSAPAAPRPQPSKKPCGKFLRRCK